MYPVLLEIGPLTIHSYGMMIAIAFLTALFFIQRDAQRASMDPKIFGDAAFFVLPIGIASTRLAHILLFPEHYSWSDPVGWIAIWNGGLVFQGAIPAVLAFLYFYFTYKGLSFWKACDVIMPYIPLAHAFGRIGCFLYGCCYGRVTEVPWGIPARRVPWDVAEAPTGSPGYLDHLHRFSDITVESQWSHAMHPTQLYAFAGLMVIYAAMIFLRKKWKPFDGAMLAVYFFVYGLFRFVVEFFRGDHNPVHMLGLSDQQLFSLFLVVFGATIFAGLKVRAAKSPTPAE